MNKDMNTDPLSPQAMSNFLKEHSQGTMAPDGNFFDVKVGDIVIREFYGQYIKLKVTAIEERLIHTGPWTFDRSTGFEEDPELGMGVAFGITCSRLVKQ